MPRDRERGLVPVYSGSISPRPQDLWLSSDGKPLGVACTNFEEILKKNPGWGWGWQRGGGAESPRLIRRPPQPPDPVPTPTSPGTTCLSASGMARPGRRCVCDVRDNAKPANSRGSGWAPSCGASAPRGPGRHVRLQGWVDCPSRARRGPPPTSVTRDFCRAGPRECPGGRQASRPRLFHGRCRRVQGRGRQLGQNVGVRQGAQVAATRWGRPAFC